jgi:receptor-type tyrosine-protein phosphatase N
MAKYSIMNSLALILVLDVTMFASGLPYRGISTVLFGCLFDPELCSYQERCINDGLFGNCQLVQGGREPDYYQFHLTLKQYDYLDSITKWLQSKGYILSHMYTQCVLSQVMYYYRYNSSVNLDVCDRHYISRPAKDMIVHTDIVFVNPKQNGMENSQSMSNEDEKQLYILANSYTAAVDVNLNKHQEQANDKDIESQLFSVASAKPHATQEQIPAVSVWTRLFSATQASVVGRSDVDISSDVISQQYVKPMIPAYMIAVYTICGVVFVAVVATVIGCICCRYKNKKDETDGINISHQCKLQCSKGSVSVYNWPDIVKTSAQLGSSRPPAWIEDPVPLKLEAGIDKSIMSYMKDHIKNKELMQREWDALCLYTPEKCSVVAALQPSNLTKNKYRDAVPYEHSRIHLIASNNVFESDYVNASVVTDQDLHHPAYIVTQGPLPHTVADFWQMIWEQGCIVIVNLTQLTENSFEVCHRYWPDTQHHYHIFEVKLLSEYIWCDDYRVRSFSLRNTKSNETRTVTQFHFVSWPENGVPPTPDTLLDFRRKVNNSFRGRTSPVLVHCSDGAGRSGTYCLIDMILGRIHKGAKEIDFSVTLQRIRDQRANMVRTKAQFEFSFFAVAREVSHGRHANH